MLNQIGFLKKILFILSAFFTFLVFNCTPPSYPNACELGSKTFVNNFILTTVGLKRDSYCGIVNSATAAANAAAANGLSFTSFSFTDTANGLSKTYIGTITGTNIAIDIPYGKLTTAVPTLATNAAVIQAGTTTVVSGVTALDFTNPVTFTLISSNGSKSVYTVTAYAITPVEDTGQNLCYLEAFMMPASPVSCASSAATYPRQDGDFVNFPNPKGYQMPSVNSLYPNDYINRNIVKGIVWKTCTEGWSGSTCSIGSTNNLNYANATTTCDNLNSANAGAGYAGLKNWRLPTFQELLQLQTYNQNGLFMDASFFPSALSVNHKTSSIMLSSGNTLNVNGSFGNSSTATAEAVRCVSGSSYPAQEFVDNGDGTILDKRTSLIWQKCSFGQTNDAVCTGTVANINMPVALTTCKNLTLAGKSWRLPNPLELMTIVDLTRNTTPYINLTYFPNSQTALNRSSTTMISNDAYGYEVGLTTLGGFSTSNNKSTGAAGYQSRCVAGP